MFDFLSKFFVEPDICDRKTLFMICDELPKKIITHSVNSTQSLNAIIKFVVYGYSQYSSEKFFDGICNFLEASIYGDKQPNIRNYMHFLPDYDEDDYDEDDIDWIDKDEWREYEGEISFFVEQEIFDSNVARFIYYYLTRLAIMLNGISYDHKPFSKNEKDIIAGNCFDYMKRTRYANYHYLTQGHFHNVLKDYWLLYEVKKESEKMAYINDYSIFLHPIGKNDLLPDISKLNSNQRKFLSILLDENFHIYYHSMIIYLSSFLEKMRYRPYFEGNYKE